MFTDNLFSAAPLYETLTEIFQLRPDFEERFTGLKKDELLVDDKKILESLSLKMNDRVVLVATSVIWSVKGWESPILFRDVDGYQEFLKQKFMGNAEPVIVAGSALERLCYATGMPSGDVGELDIASRYSINKMFVTTTINYASGLDSSAFRKSYQVDRETQTYLERASG